jgi:hypothetical protein
MLRSIGLWIYRDKVCVIKNFEGLKGKQITAGLKLDLA